MPFKMHNGQYVYRPIGHADLRGGRGDFPDENSVAFEGSNWCPRNMYSEYCQDNGILVDDDLYLSLRFNGAARCYRGAPPPPPPPIPEYTRNGDVAFTGTTKRPYFMPYDTHEEINLRLQGSVIRLDGMPVYIEEVKPRAGGFSLQFLDHNQNRMLHGYSEGSGFDLSPFMPRYGLNKNTSRRALWCFRKPVKGVYRQGATRNNTFVRVAGSKAEGGIGDYTAIIGNYLKPNDTRQVSESIKSLSETKASIALSDDVAIWDNWKDVSVEYHGMIVGKFNKTDVSNGLAKFKASTELTPWMERKLLEVGLEAK